MFYQTDKSFYSGEMEATTRLCKYDGMPINLSIERKDRQFCNEVCKNKYHNEQTYKEELEIKRIQLILKKNRRILKKMAARKDGDEIPRERLLKEGFEFNFHTHLKDTKHGGYTYTFSFDCGYRMINKTTYIKRSII